jgi:23S rRNA (guanosine2251-2'-O)-methyltransferase
MAKKHAMSTTSGSLAGDHFVRGFIPDIRAIFDHATALAVYRSMTYSSAMARAGKKTRDRKTPYQGRDQAPNRGQGREQAPHRGRDPASNKGPGQGASNALYLYGRHAVEAALANRHRESVLLKATDRALKALTLPEGLRVETTSDAELAAIVGAAAPHQGMVLQARALPGRHLDEVRPEAKARNLVVVLDQVTDPHNVGAILRSAIAFGARALITTERHAPHESGALAKAASGALDMLPWIRVTNLSRALDDLAEMGYWRIGLDGGGDQLLAGLDMGENIALVLGAEGHGLRDGTRKHVDVTARLPIDATIGSLNVSNAAAVALYELAGKQTAG